MTGPHAAQRAVCCKYSHVFIEDIQSGGAICERQIKLFNGAHSSYDLNYKIPCEVNVRKI